MKVASALLAAVALLLCAGIRASAVPNRDGDLFVTFDGSLHPTRLPRQRPAPVAVRVAGNIRSVSGHPDQLPQLRRISVAINRQGKLFDLGLPICSVNAIQPASEAAARKVCGGSIVGEGHIRLRVRIPGQLPFLVRAKLLAFNGPRRGGDKLILAQAYARKPPGAFVLVFRIRRHPGLFGTVMATTLPRGARRWAFLTHFDMTLHRVYSYRGKLRSYVSAACGAPPGFDAVVFPFARATYGFANGQRLTTSVTQSCHIT